MISQQTGIKRMDKDEELKREWNIMKNISLKVSSENENEKVEESSRQWSLRWIRSVCCFL